MYLSNALKVIDRLLATMEGQDSFDQFSENERVKAAALWYMIVLSESVRDFLNEREGNELENLSLLLSFQAWFVYSFGKFDEIAWTIIKKDIIPLKEEIQRKLL